MKPRAGFLKRRAKLINFSQAHQEEMREEKNKQNKN